MMPSLFPSWASSTMVTMSSDDQLLVLRLSYALHSFHVSSPLLTKCPVLNTHGPNLMCSVIALFAFLGEISEFLIFNVSKVYTCHLYPQRIEASDKNSCYSPIRGGRTFYPHKLLGPSALALGTELLLEVGHWARSERLTPEEKNHWGLSQACRKHLLSLLKD